MKSIVIAAILLAVGVVATRATRHRHHWQRLALHTTARPHAIYFSAWGDGDGHAGIVHIKRTDGALHPIRFTTRASVSDGCRWLGTETLLPIDNRTYSYSYEETILDCDPDAKPALKTPRTGYVTIED